MAVFEIKLVVSILLVAVIKEAQSAILQKHSHSLDPKANNWERLDDEGTVRFRWEVDEKNETVTFWLLAETLGWVGFGISPNGGMPGSDIFIAGVFPNGTTYSSDRHATAKAEPIVDDHSDWTLIEAWEEGLDEDSPLTYLKFSRKINTCDPQDYPMGVDTNRLIWALGETDEVKYHMTNRGTKSVNLLGAPMPEADLEGMLEWKMTVDMEMPKVDTSYWCTFHKGPEMDGKRQIVAFEPFIPNADALAHTHHFILYNCYKDPNSDVPLSEVFKNRTVEEGDFGGECHVPWDGSEPIPLKYYCPEYLYVWAKGGKRLVFPENVGYPIGPNKGELFYMLEIHYDNPELKDTKFETGMKFYYTDDIRPQDAGLLVVGHDVIPSITVPPNTTDFVTVGHCGSHCTQSKIPEEGVNVFNALLHSHSSGRKLKLRHFRDGEELPWLDFDDHYDFDYQQNKHLGSEVKLLPGDHMTFECTYDSWWKNGQVVIGGLSTREEMCQTFLWYYPKMDDFDVCISYYDLEQSLEDLGITNFTINSEVVGNAKVIIYAPEELAGDYEESLSTKFVWTEKLKQELEEKRRYSEHSGVCVSRLEADPMPNFPVKYPDFLEPYEPENVCERDNDGSTTENGEGSTSNGSTDDSTTEGHGTAVRSVLHPVLWVFLMAFGIVL